MLQTSKKNPWVAHRPNKNARMRLFCLPYAGGGASAFRPWLELLPDYVDVCPIIYPGRELRLKEPPFTNVISLMEACAAALMPLMDMPFSIFGYSMGAMIGFELTRYLRRYQMPMPQELFLAAYLPPQPGPSSRSYHKLPDEEFIKHLRRLGGTPEKALQSPELLEILLPLLRADFTAFDTYCHVPEPALDCSLRIFGGLEDPGVDQKLLLEWRNHTNADCSFYMLPGNHFFLNSAQSELLAILTKYLEQLIASHSNR